MFYNFICETIQGVLQKLYITELVMKKKLVLFILCLIIIGSLLVGCNNMKQKPISSDFTNKTIASNGGLAVQYGNYIYFVNGISAQDADNTFGKVTKGAIARLELDAQGKIVEDSTKIIIPKIAFATEKNSGLTIQDGYIYYSTPSTEKNSKGEPKVDAMWLVRSSLDGSKTEVVKKFKDFSITYKVMDGHIVYDITNEDGEKELRSISLNEKKFPDKLLASKITSKVFVSAQDGVHSLRNYVFYTKANEKETDYSNVVYIANGSGSVNKAVLDKGKYSADNLLHPDGYMLSITDTLIVDNDTIKLIYNKADRGVNTISMGTYSYDFKVSTDFSFNEEQEIRYSSGTNYSKLRFLTDKYILASKSDKIELLTLENKTVSNREEVMSFLPTFYSFEIVDDNLETTYAKDNKFYRIKLFDIGENETYTLNLGTATLLYDQSVSTTWLDPEVIGDYLYFFNSSIADNAYALDLGKVEPRNDKSRTPLLIGIMTYEDEIEAM